MVFTRIHIPPDHCDGCEAPERGPARKLSLRSRTGTQILGFGRQSSISLLLMQCCTVPSALGPLKYIGCREELVVQLTARQRGQAEVLLVLSVFNPPQCNGSKRTLLTVHYFVCRVDRAYSVEGRRSVFFSRKASPLRPFKMMGSIRSFV